MELLCDKEFKVYWTLCGSDGNNAYIIVCPVTNESIIIDAPMNPEEIIKRAEDTQVKVVFITHRHRDHWEGLKDITDATGAPMAAHPEDAADMPVSPDILVTDGDMIRVGTVEVNVIHTPGHTAGSVCYLAGDYLFTGDTLYAHAPGESRGVEATQQVIKSITEKLFALPEDTFIFPGHGLGSTIGRSKALYRAWALEYPDLLPPIPDQPI